MFDNYNYQYHDEWLWGTGSKKSHVPTVVLSCYRLVPIGNASILHISLALEGDQQYSQRSKTEHSYAFAT